MNNTSTDTNALFASMPGARLAMMPIIAICLFG
jgi:hypothetical protein